MRWAIARAARAASESPSASRTCTRISRVSIGGGGCVIAYSLARCGPNLTSCTCLAMVHCVTILPSSLKEAAMLKLLLVFPVMILGSILFGVGALLFLPMLSLLPIVLAVGACVVALSLTAGILLFVVRLFGALMIAGLVATVLF